MKVASIDRPNRLSIRTVNTPVPKATEILIKVDSCGICGTDLHIFGGDYIGTYPIVPGHELSGTVTAVGSRVQGFNPGDAVAIEPNISCGHCQACLRNEQNFCERRSAVGVTRPGGFAEYTVVPAENAFQVGTMDLEVAAFVEPLSCVIHGLLGITVVPGDRVVVVGGGPIGNLLARTSHALGAGCVFMAEPDPIRRSFAAKCEEYRRVEASIDSFEKDSFDLVIDATGVPALLTPLVSMARPGGRVLLFGVPPQKSTGEMDLFAVFRKGLIIRGSYTSVRNSYQAIKLLSERRVVVNDLITHRISIDELGSGFNLMKNKSELVQKIIIKP